MIVPIRYQVNGEFIDNELKYRGKVTWFFYLIYIKFTYDEEFHKQIKVFGIPLRNSNSGKKSRKQNKKKRSQEGLDSEVMKEELHENRMSSSHTTNDLRSEKKLDIGENCEEELTAWEKEMEEEAKEEAKFAKKIVGESSNHKTSSKSKETFSDKVDKIKSKLINIVQKIKDLIVKIQEKKLKIEHYLEIWNKKETQIALSKGKKRLKKMIQAILPRRWNIIGEMGFAEPATTGQAMGVLGVLYPILGSNVAVTPNFDNEIISLEGSAKGRIRLGNLIYQLIAFLLNKDCLEFVKIVLEERADSKKGKKEK